MKIYGKYISSQFWSRVFYLDLGHEKINFSEFTLVCKKQVLVLAKTQYRKGKIWILLSELIDAGFCSVYEDKRRSPEVQSNTIYSAT